MSKKRYREWTLDQPYLLPPSLRDWLPEDHRVFRILEVVDELDLVDIIDEVDSRDARGTRPYHPRMMLALLIYAYSEGVYSSRRIARAAEERVPFRVLTANQAPHFTVINRFRDRHRGALPGLFAQLVMLCGRLGLVDFSHVSIDGTKLPANASKHKAMSYGRMEIELKRLKTEIRRLLERAEAEDAAEDAEYGEGVDIDELPAELKRREDRIARIKEAMAELEAEARETKAQELREQAERQRGKAATESDPVERKRKMTRAKCAAEKADRLDPEPNSEEDDEVQTQLPMHRVETTKDGAPTERAQRNFTDPESRIMCRNKEFIQGYNAQTAVDARHQVIVAVGVSNQAPDQEHLLPMLERVKEIAGRTPDVLTADAGYMSSENALYCEEEGIDAYIATSRKRSPKKHLSIDDNQQARPPEWQAMDEKLRSDQGRRIYARRKTITEPVFGQIREARGLRRFSLRGLIKVEAEWILVAISHNILKMVSAAASPQHAPALAAL